MFLDQVYSESRLTFYNKLSHALYHECSHVAPGQIRNIICISKKKKKNFFHLSMTRGNAILKYDGTLTKSQLLNLVLSMSRSHWLECIRPCHTYYLRPYQQRRKLPFICTQSSNQVFRITHIHFYNFLAGKSYLKKFIWK